MFASKYFQSTIVSSILLVVVPGFCFAEHSTLTSIQPIRLSAAVPLLGTVVVDLDKQKDFGTQTTSRFYQGTVKYRGLSYPAAASIINGVTKITFNGRPHGSRKSRRRMYSLTLKSGDHAIRASSVPSSAMPEKGCPVKDHGTSVSTDRVTAQAADSKVIYISTYADPEFVYSIGTNANDEIARIINTAEALYEQQLGIRFKIVEQVLLTNSTPEISAPYILDAFRATLSIRKSDTQVLFTGKDMTGTTVGIAYVSALCREPTYAQSVVQFYGDLTSNIFAHEFGHTAGAGHDTSSPGSIMYPSISFGQPYFSSKSLSDINSYLSVYGTCLKTETLPPTLNGAKLTMKRGKLSAVSFVLVSRNGVPIANQRIQLDYARRLVTVTTNAKGVATIRLRKYKGKYLSICAWVDDDANIYACNTIRIT